VTQAIRGFLGLRAAVPTQNDLSDTFFAAKAQKVLLPAIPIHVAAIAIQVTVIVPQLPAFIASTAVVSAVEIAPQFPAIMRNPCLIVPNVAAITPVAILAEHRSGTKSEQQQNSSHHAFHIYFSFSRLIYGLARISIYWI
jgi:hypothetical protein